MSEQNRKPTFKLPPPDKFNGKTGASWRTFRSAMTSYLYQFGLSKYLVAASQSSIRIDTPPPDSADDEPFHEASSGDRIQTRSRTKDDAELKEQDKAALTAEIEAARKRIAESLEASKEIFHYLVVEKI